MAYKLPSVEESILGPAVPGETASILSSEVLTTWFGTGAFAILTVFVLFGIRRRVTGRALLASCVATTAALGAALVPLDRLAQDVLDVVATIAWMGMILRALGVRLGWAAAPGLERQQELGRAVAVIVGAALLFVVFCRVDLGLVREMRADAWVFATKLMLSIGGLVLVEQLVRNTRRDFQWNMKFMSLALAMMFLIDFLLYADAMLFGRLSSRLIELRPVVFGLAVPLIIVASGRNRSNVLNVNLSRQFVFRTGVMLFVGGYLIVIAAAGYYLRLFGGSWGGVLQATFVVVALVALAILASSTQLRSWAWVTISRNLYEYKYDYREEWRKLTQRLTDADGERTLATSVIVGLSDIIHSPAGAMWLDDGHGGLQPESQYSCPWDFALAADDQRALRAFLAERDWIIDVNQWRRQPDHYAGLELSPSLVETPGLRFIIPLWVGQDLLGLVMLAEPRIPIELIWEDFDMLKVAARQTAGALSQDRASSELSYAREFEAFHQMSAFVVHDLKTVVAQLSLMAENAELHRDNPAFFDDMVRTSKHAVERMQRLLQQLRDPGQSAIDSVDVGAAVRAAVAGSEGNLPVPVLSIYGDALLCRADRERLIAVIGHIIKNAQDATPDDGQIQVRVSSESNWIKVTVEDSGAGMDEEFVRRRLFQPFETTKGIAGMGIGVYQTREYLRSLGGNIQVVSTPGLGSTFVLTLPPAE